MSINWFDIMLNTAAFSIAPGLTAFLGGHLAAEAAGERTRIVWRFCFGLLFGLSVILTGWQQFRVAESDLDRKTEETWQQGLLLKTLFRPISPPGIAYLKTVKPVIKTTLAAQPTFSITNPTGSIINQGSPNFGSQTVTNNLGTPERALTESQQQIIKAGLGPPANGFQGVYCLLGDQEGEKYAFKFREVFKDANWDTGKTVGRDALDSTPEGLFIVISPDDKQSPPEGALRIARALKQAGLNPIRYTISPVKSGDYYLLIGANPKPPK